MREKLTGKASAKVSTDWKRLISMTDREVRRAIDGDPQAEATDAKFWKTARVVPVGKLTAPSRSRLGTGGILA